ncbi:hypothetical protein C0992_007073 [Termitomyces sp. T32_za158]|nr:hypothetical protein C0992_007073 [Termitomyces sp. T32_za158]
MPLYSFFSLEELRVHAYLRGHKHPPTPIDPAPFVVAPIARAPAPAADPCTDHLLTISAQPEYAAHSLEELRVAYIHAGAGRDLSSAEIRARAPVPASTFAPRAPATSPFGTAAYPFAPGYRG